jgi:hypothetical protein
MTAATIKKKLNYRDQLIENTGVFQRPGRSKPIYVGDGTSVLKLMRMAERRTGKRQQQNPFQSTRTENANSDLR